MSVTIQMYQVQQVNKVYKICMPPYLDGKNDVLVQEVAELTSDDIVGDYSGEWSEHEWLYSMLDNLDYFQIDSLPIGGSLRFPENRDIDNGDCTLIRVQ